MGKVNCIQKRKNPEKMKETRTREHSTYKKRICSRDRNLPRKPGDSQQKLTKKPQ